MLPVPSRYFQQITTSVVSTATASHRYRPATGLSFRSGVFHVSASLYPSLIAIAPNPNHINRRATGKKCLVGIKKALFRKNPFAKCKHSSNYWYTSTPNFLWQWRTSQSRQLFFPLRPSQSISRIPKKRMNAIPAIIAGMLLSVMSTIR